MRAQLPQHLFGTAGFAYIGAMVCSIEALKYVNFPTKELGKSCKVGMVAVQLGNLLFFFLGSHRLFYLMPFGVRN